TPLDDPDLAPINASPKGLPPVHLSVGLRDLFLADVRVARLQLERHGLDLSYREISGRLGMELIPRRGADIERRHRAPADVTERVLSRPSALSSRRSPRRRRRSAAGPSGAWGSHGSSPRSAGRAPACR